MSVVNFWHRISSTTLHSCPWCLFFIPPIPIVFNSQSLKIFASRLNLERKHFFFSIEDFSSRLFEWLKWVFNFHRSLIIFNISMWRYWVENELVEEFKSSFYEFRKWVELLLELMKPLEASTWPHSKTQMKSFEYILILTNHSSQQRSGREGNVVKIHHRLKYYIVFRALKGALHIQVRLGGLRGTIV